MKTKAKIYTFLFTRTKTKINGKPRTIQYLTLEQCKLDYELCTELKRRRATG